MKMEYYLKEVEYASKSLLEAIWFEFDIFEKLNKEMSEHFPITISKFQDWESQKSHPWEPIPESLTSELNKIIKQGEKNEELKNRLKVKNFSRSSLSGNLLSIAKQGMSYVNEGKPKDWPDGRMIGSLSLKEIIIQGRNQSLHWEEKKLSKPVAIFFKQLIQTYGLTMFGMFQHQNLGFNIIRILNWRDFDDFKSDMLLLSQ